MKNTIRLALALLCCFSVYATGVSVAHAEAEEITNRDNPGLTQEEAVVAEALSIRAKQLEISRRIKFGDDWQPKVSIISIFSSYATGGIDGLYVAETQTICIATRIMYELNARFRMPLHLLTADTLARDPQFGRLADHELGHALSDLVSRRIRKKPFFTVVQFEALSPEEQLGLNIVAEGVGTFFERTYYPTNDQLSEIAFPSTLEEQRFYSYEIVAFEGGYWLVKDVLEQYGELGLKWLINNPFVASGTDMRAAAVSYRLRALQELARL